MTNYELAYLNREGKLHSEIVEGAQALLDSMSILDRNGVSYDAYVIRPNGNHVELSESEPYICSECPDGWYEGVLGHEH